MTFLSVLNCARAGQRAAVARASGVPRVGRAVGAEHLHGAEAAPQEAVRRRPHQVRPRALRAARRGKTLLV